MTEIFLVLFRDVKATSIYKTPEEKTFLADVSIEMFLLF